MGRTGKRLSVNSRSASRKTDGFSPATTAPMEAKSALSLPEGEGWQFEPKWDGFRCLVFKAGKNVELRAKSGKPLGRYFPEIVASVESARVDEFVVDGELLTQLDGQLSFEALQMRLHPAESRIRHLSTETPARLMLFDVLVGAQGVDQTLEPLVERRAALETLFAKLKCKDRIALSPFTRDPDTAAQWLTGGFAGTDGVIAKRLDGIYQPGERAMIKVKRLRTADCVIGGFRYAADRHEVGSLLLGLYDCEGKLNHVGFTSTMADKERPALTRRLEKLRHPPGFTGKAPGGPSRWNTARSGEWEPLTPKLVVEVRFDHVTGNRFRHGTKLLRWRPDKAPHQCTFEQLKIPEPS
jgi:ATP-dependent DNA ligase